MQEAVQVSSPKYRAFVTALIAICCVGIVAYVQQVRYGLSVTGLSRDVPWGLYISQFTFLVGVAASSVLVVLPHYVHGKEYNAPLVIVAEAISVVALIEAFCFVLVDLGRPARVLGVLIYAAPSSLMFWDIGTLSVYLLLCGTILASSLLSPGGSHPHWVRPLVLLSIPFAFGIHIVTALLYSGLAARAGWFSAILAPKFLATAFASGSALLTVVASALGANHSVAIDRKAVALLSSIMTYALAAVLLFTALEIFTNLYSGVPWAEEHTVHQWVPGGSTPGIALSTLTSMVLALIAFGILLHPALRRRSRPLNGACLLIFLSVFIEKGLLFIPSGFSPSVLGGSASYRPNIIELAIAGGIHAAGLLIFLSLLRRTHAKFRYCEQM